jgi:hypothetical protein
MKEPFVTASTIDLNTQTQVISDMALNSYLSSLNPSQNTAFLAGNASSALAAVNNAKDKTYGDTMDLLTGADNSITSAAYYLSRTRDLADATEQIDQANLSQLDASQINAGLSQRQTEINEWANRNKLDTLYFMQVLFISLSLTGFLAFLSSNGYISGSLFRFVSYIIGILAVIVLILRWRYTYVARNARYWHKARFPMQDVIKTTGAKCKTGWFS